MTKSKFIRRGSDTTAASAVCGVVFCLFSFIYLFFYQDDLLTMEQHVLSKGLTHYNRIAGALIITLLLQLMQVAVDAATRKCTKHPAMTYFIPFTAIAVITDVSPAVDNGYTLGAWAWAIPVLMAGYALATYVSASLLANNNGPGKKSQYRILWENLTVMAALMVFTCATSNTDSIFHTRMKIDRLVSEGYFSEALEQGKHNARTDSSTTMLRAYALSRTGKMGEKLFEYPLCGGSDALLPNGTSVKAMICPEAQIFRNVARPANRRMRTKEYLTRMRRMGYSKKPLHDYILCAYLMDKDIDSFAKEIAADPRYTGGTLPKHYREALVLYNHIRSNPVTSYTNTVTDADYTDLQSILKCTADKAERKAKARETFGNTYWFYWLYS